MCLQGGGGNGLHLVEGPSAVTTTPREVEAEPSHGALSSTCIPGMGGGGQRVVPGCRTLSSSSNGGPRFPREVKAMGSTWL